MMIPLSREQIYFIESCYNTKGLFDNKINLKSSENPLMNKNVMCENLFPRNSNNITNEYINTIINKTIDYIHPE